MSKKELFAVRKIFPTILEFASLPRALWRFFVPKTHPSGQTLDLRFFTHLNEKSTASPQNFGLRASFLDISLHGGPQFPEKTVVSEHNVVEMQGTLQGCGAR
jgi:hypothetical protein